MFVHDMKNRVYMAPLSVKTSLDMNTNRDKAVSLGGTAEMSAVPFFVNEPEPYVTSVPAPGEPERNIARWLCE